VEASVPDVDGAVTGAAVVGGDVAPVTGATVVDGVGGFVVGVVAAVVGVVVAGADDWNVMFPAAVSLASSPKVSVQVSPAAS
jgi:hypothetical protein